MPVLLHKHLRPLLQAALHSALITPLYRRRDAGGVTLALGGSVHPGRARNKSLGPGPRPRGRGVGSARRRARPNPAASTSTLFKSRAPGTAASPLAVSPARLCPRCRARTGAPALPPPAATDTARAQLTAGCSLDPAPHGSPGDACGGRGQGPVGIVGPLCFLTNSTDP